MFSESARRALCAFRDCDKDGVQEAAAADWLGERRQGTVAWWRQQQTVTVWWCIAGYLSHGNVLDKRRA
jgi:hypothetical protein